MYISNLKFFFACFLLGMSMTFLSGCTSDDDAAFAPCEYVQFEQELYTRTITLRQSVLDVLEDYEVTEEMQAPYKKELEAILRPNIKYSAHAITYNTVSPDGTPTIASGMIYYPITFKPKGVIEVTPINKSKGSCGTECNAMAEILPGMMGYIVIVPDLIGCGVTDDIPISYIQHENVAVVSADLRKAADEYIYNRYHHHLSHESILFGYSLGAAGSLSLARYYDQHPNLGVEVSHLFIGGGAYEPLQVIKSQLNDNRSDYAIIPNILVSLNYYDHLNLDFSKIFKGELLQNYEKWCDGFLPIAELTKKLGNDLTKYFSDYILENLRTAPEFQKLMAVVESKTVPLDWVPSAQIHLFHSKYDYYVPTACGDHLYAYLKQVGAKVDYVKYDMDHLYSGLLIELDFAKFLASLK